jgi:EAL domain-containing protein (putative c-di-GMP-specific phosphodiesterase class I)
LEDTSLIVPVGSWVIRQACEQVSRWIEAGLSVPKISVNVSPRQFQRQDFAAHVGEIIAACGIDASYIELEITETMLMIDPAHAVSELAQLKSIGVGLSVDDFGTGYSSLAYLKRFPLDTLKIDIAFIRETCTDPDSAAITLAIIDLAHNLRLKVVAEGVETAPQFNFLASHGVISFRDICSPNRLK